MSVTEDSFRKTFIELDVVLKKNAIRINNSTGDAVNALTALKFWEMQGLTLAQIESTYSFDFVITSDGTPVILKGEFVVIT